jgi:hypothetical protein
MGLMQTPALKLKLILRLEIIRFHTVTAVRKWRMFFSRTGTWRAGNSGQYPAKIRVDWVILILAQNPISGLRCLLYTKKRKAKAIKVKSKGSYDDKKNSLPAIKRWAMFYGICRR